MARISPTEPSDSTLADHSSHLRVSYRDNTWSILDPSPEELVALKELLPEVCRFVEESLSFEWPAAYFTPATVELEDTEEFVRWLHASEHWPKYVTSGVFHRYELSDTVAYRMIADSLDPQDLAVLDRFWGKIANICTLEDVDLVRESLLDNTYRGTAPEELAYLSRKIVRAHREGCLTSEVYEFTPAPTKRSPAKQTTVKKISPVPSRPAVAMPPWPAPDPLAVVDLPPPPALAPPKPSAQTAEQ